MNRDKFKEEMAKKRCGHSEVLSKHEQEAIMQESIKKMDELERTPMRGYYNIVIVVEELAELSKELTKALRGKGDLDGILEELADVLDGIEYVKEIFDIPDRELDYACSIKMEEVKNRVCK